jgi:7-cyano-7-deazaguanine synthase in queuosine biosynthesis
MTTVEILPAGTAPTHPGARHVQWPSHPDPDGPVVLDADAFLTRFGPVPEPAIDLARVAVGAYLADRLLRRSSVAWSRDITLVVHLVDPNRFAPAIEALTLLLDWVSGDNWTLVAVPDTSARRDPATVEPTSRVCLASGGLDSTCGALLAPSGTTLFGHRDNKAVAHAQTLIRADLAGRPYEQIRVGVRRTAERSSRSRSIMFAALGTALAAARNADTLIIPENGFTSLNPPLSAARGGPRTTRSTHPTTIAYLNAVNIALDLGVTIQNPYEWLTKGDLIHQTAEAVGTDRLEEIVPHTFSCATANTQFFKGGSAFRNCGVCVACMTRRGGIRAAGLPDHTQYTVDYLAPDVRAEFLAERGQAVPLVTALRGWKPGTAQLIAMGPFPTRFDYDRAMDLLARGLEQLTLGLP